MKIRRTFSVFAAVVALSAASQVSAQTSAPEGRTVAPEGKITFAVTITLAPTWFDPAETPGVITPFLTLYALHDALVKPMPGNPFAPSLAESWTAAKDGLTYEFTLRKGVKFHNGDPVTPEDVKFSYENYRGAKADVFKRRTERIDIVDDRTI